MIGFRKSYGLLSETSTIEETRNPAWQRHLPARAPLDWLSSGWRDLWQQPMLSLVYGVLIFALSVLCVWIMVAVGWDYFLFPAISGFMIVAPVLATGLYAKSRALEAGQSLDTRSILLARPLAGAQIFFTGLLLCLLLLVWMRAAVLVYALFFGIRPFPGIDHIAEILFTTPVGWAMLVVGGFVGALFAGFAFAISVFSIPMLLDRRVDAFTAMGSSIALVWNNLPVMLTWGAIVLGLFLICVATGFIGLIVIFPLLGHATWHAYGAMR